jgi:DUF305 family protein family protein
MVIERESTQIDSGFLTERLKGTIRFTYISARMLGLLLLIVGIGAHGPCVQAESNAHDSRLPTNPDWSELIASMDKMHMAMGAVVRSGNSDVDFVRLMLPHHQAAIDMAKTQLLYGKDPQMRRLAQEIITDQQLEIELMQRWLKQRESTQPKETQPPPANTGKENQR